MSVTRKPGLANNPLERRPQPRTGAHQDGTHASTRRTDLLTSVTRKPGLANNPLERRKPRLPNLVEQGVDVAGLANNPFERRKRRLPNLVEQGVDVAQEAATIAEPVALGEEKKTTRRVPADKKQESVYINRAKAENGKNAVAAIGHIAGAPNSWSTLVDEALAHYLAVLERTYNNGEPFPPRKAERARGPRIN
ncbi:hypothetical protein RHA1_ro02894 [Rhodococcus jostii RHA1]|uniref:Centromere-binding protein ParB C-terminal domain-containing protein n=1 Tax=Rhodococcus jostii (strain RHA1) TaxID=101510 RepID=Q0SCN7_RHOJR|nr:hypothetical protein [Rhodococcus jostii]ABG94699.1 hypothetical protein RHA1_ro02894 [Rhodococcus jostii RHA1]